MGKNKNSLKKIGRVTEQKKVRGKEK